MFPFLPRIRLMILLHEFVILQLFTLPFMLYEYMYSTVLCTIYIGAPFCFTFNPLIPVWCHFKNRIFKDSQKAPFKKIDNLANYCNYYVHIDTTNIKSLAFHFFLSFKNSSNAKILNWEVFCEKQDGFRNKLQNQFLHDPKWKNCFHVL